MSKVVRVWAREILDSRGWPTVETAVQADSGHIAVVSVPSAATVREGEAQELRDGDQKRFLGRGVLKAVSSVNQKIGPAIAGMDLTGQFDVDKKLVEIDGSTTKKNLGVNAVLSVSIAVLKLGSLVQRKPLYGWIFELSRRMEAVSSEGVMRVPTPVFNVVTGGVYGSGRLDFQEFQVIPATSRPFSNALQIGAEVYHNMKQILIKRGAVHAVSDEGGYTPNLFTNMDALSLCVEAISATGYQVGRDFFLGLDAAASMIFKNGRYSIKDQNQPMDASGLISFYEGINKQYHLTLLEDPLSDNDWQGWTEIMSKLGESLMIVGDDLLYTNLQRVSRASELQACNAIVIKPNQVGTFTETLGVIRQARLSRWKIIVSQRSGETNDWWLADFAVGVRGDFVKFGAPARGERIAKYNRLLNIEAELVRQKSQLKPQ